MVKEELNCYCENATTLKSRGVGSGVGREGGGQGDERRVEVIVKMQKKKSGVRLRVGGSGWM